MSFVGNRGTFTRGYRAMIMDVEFLYHVLYLIICSLGVFVHVFFYSLLVSPMLTVSFSSSVALVFLLFGNVLLSVWGVGNHI